jgi:lysophospholipase L1-like esterase
LIHQRFWEDEDGNIVTENSPEYMDAFKKCCENNNIKAIDVTKQMIESYIKDFEFSYGFPNTAPGEGHLNKTGHRIIAEEVYKSINKMEEKK